MFKSFALAVFFVALLAACSAPLAPSSSGAMALADFSQGAKPAEPVEVGLDTVTEGTKIRLSYQLNESVKIEIMDTNQMVIIDRARWDPYTNETIVWVRDNGDRLNLVEAVRASLSEPIVGTVHIAKDDDGTAIFEVYKNSDLIPNP